MEDFDELYFTDTPCPKCGEMMVSRQCGECGGEGFTEPGELYELNPDKNPQFQPENVTKEKQP